jgi:hypothetical protein
MLTNYLIYVCSDHVNTNYNFTAPQWKLILQHL